MNTTGLEGSPQVFPQVDIPCNVSLKIKGDPGSIYKIKQALTFIEIKKKYNYVTKYNYDMDMISVTERILINITKVVNFYL